MFLASRVRLPVIAALGFGLLTGLAAGAQAQVTDTRSYLQQMDRDGDGRISEAEYVAWLLYAFDRMDYNGDGVLEAAELPGGRGAPITRARQAGILQQRFHKQDANGDGFLDARELSAPPR